MQELWKNFQPTEQHERSDENPNRKPFQCAECGEQFHVESCLCKHVISHGGKKTSEYDEMNCDTGTPLTFQQDQLNMCPLITQPEHINPEVVTIMLTYCSMSYLDSTIVLY